MVSVKNEDTGVAYRKSVEKKSSTKSNKASK